MPLIDLAAHPAGHACCHEGPVDHDAGRPFGLDVDEAFTGKVMETRTGCFREPMIIAAYMAVDPSRAARFPAGSRPFRCVDLHLLAGELEAGGTGCKPSANAPEQQSEGSGHPDQPRGA
jgi:hypothetical protein